MAINKAKQYTNFVDEVYKQESATRLLEMANQEYKPVSADTVLVNDITLSGCYTYSRSTGYAAGAVANSWKPYQLTIERGIKVPIDTMDLEEARIQSAGIANKWFRESFFPELDLYRFAKIKTDFATAGGSTVEATLTYDTAVAAIDTAIKVMNNNEVPKNGRILYVSEDMYMCLKQAGDFFTTRLAYQNNGILNRDIQMFDGMPIIPVVSNRFNTAVTLGEGTNTITGKYINFMIVHQPAVMAIIKHSDIKIIEPKFNADSDGAIVCIRVYHDLNLLSNKALKGVYIHTLA
jgi:hypothetical protein